MGGATATKSKKNTNGNNGGQGEFKNMPTRSGLGKMCYEYLTRQGQIKALEDKQMGLGNTILAKMKEDKQYVVKFQDPDTKEYREFKINKGHDKLSVRKIPEKFNK